MKDWNVVATARGSSYPDARRILRRLGRVDRTPFHNVLVMHVEDPRAFLDQVGDLVAHTPGVLDAVARVFPFERCFEFSDSAEFETNARHVAREWAPRLAGKSFHVRIHRRGRKGELSSVVEERVVADAMLDALRAAGTSAHVTFDDPDAIVLIDTVGSRGGMALWTRDELRRYPFVAAH